MKILPGIIAALLICLLALAVRGQGLPALEWVWGLGGTESDYGYGIATDASGNVYTVGGFSGTADFDPGPGSHTFVSNGSSDLYISKLNSSGGFVWAKQVGGIGRDQGDCVVLDNAGNIYVAGMFRSSNMVDFNPGPGIFNMMTNPPQSCFVLKLTLPAGLALIFMPTSWTKTVMLSGKRK